MFDSIQNQIKKAVEVIKESPTLEQLFDVIPDSITAHGKSYILRIEPLKGGLTFVDFVEIDRPQEDCLIHIEGQNLHDAMEMAIECLAENVTNEWKY